MMGRTLADSCFPSRKISDQKLQDYKRISPIESKCVNISPAYGKQHEPE